MPLKVFLVEDEEPARRKLGRLLAEDPDVVVTGEAATGREAIRGIDEMRPDVVFLDVRLPDMDGFDVLAACGLEPLPEVVFVTAYDEYAIRAFQVRALSYLLKPYDRDQLQKTLAYLKDRLMRPSRPSGDELLELLESHLGSQRRYPPRLLIRDGERARLITPQDIDYVESARNHVVIHAGGQSFVLRGTLDSVNEKLDPAHFARISRSHIVRLDRIVELNPWFHGEYKLRLADGSELTWTRRYLDNLPGGPV